MGILKTCPTCGVDYAGRACPSCSQAVTEKRGASVAPPGPRTDGPLQAGGTFRGIEILQELGRGGMGVVYKARQPALDRLVALKILPPERARLPGFEQRFQREAKAMAALSHPNIVAIHEFGHEGKLFFFVMEFVEGRTLRGLRPPPEEAVRILVQVCDALDFAHRKGVVHRDIKPDNILLDADGRVRIADFGLAKLADVDVAPLTQTSEGLGTLRYMAPEQMDDPTSVDHRADIYSAGVMLYELFTGQVPMGRFEPPSRVSKLNPRLDAVVLKALSRKREERYASAAEFRDDLRAALGVPGPRGAKPGRSPMIPVAAMSALGLAGILLWALWPEPAQPPVVAFPRFEFARPPDRKEPDPPKKQLELRMFRQHTHRTPMASVALGPEGHMAMGAVDGLVFLWDCREERPPRPRPGFHTAEVRTIAVTPKGRRFVTGGLDREINVWEPGGETRKLGGHAGSVNSLAFSPMGTEPVLVSAGEDGVVKVWEARTNRELRAFAVAGGSRLHAVAFRPDGRILAVACHDGTIRFYDTARWEETKVLRGHGSWVRCLAFSPSGKILASGGEDASVRFWDAESGAEKRSFQAHPTRVHTLAFSPDSKLLATGGYEPVLKIWDVESEALLGEYRGHTMEIRCVSFNMDGSLLASASTDKTVRIWEIRR